MRRPLHWFDYLSVNVYFLGLTSLNQALVSLILPLLIQQFVGVNRQGTYMGRIRLWGLMLALLSQALWGMLSDRNRSPWGRRRPFIFVATFFNIAFVLSVGFVAPLPGLAGFFSLFVIYLLLQLSVNAAHGALQGLIPDLVPPEKLGIFSGIKALFEVPLPIVLVSLVIAPLVANGQLWPALFVLSALLLGLMIITLLTKEEPLTAPPPPLNWRAFLRLLMMTAAFTAIILLLGELLKFVGYGLRGTFSQLLALLVMGSAGFVAMVVAILAGVSVGMRISFGGHGGRQRASFTWWVISRLAYLTGCTNLAGFVLYFLQARLGYSQASAAQPASNMMIFVGISILLSALPAGWLADRWGRKRVVAWSGVVAALGALVTLLAPNLSVVCAGGSIIGLATGVFYAASWALGTRLVPPAEAGRYLGLSNLAGAGAGALGAYIGGPIADFFTHHVPAVPGLGYVLIFGIYGLLFLFSTLTLMMVEEPSAIS